ncbi:hypothetical protein RCL1_004513 [Eukaryota sp. TZLM3-RCL]
MVQGTLRTDKGRKKPEVKIAKQKKTPQQMRKGRVAIPTKRNVAEAQMKTSVTKAINRTNEELMMAKAKHNKESFRIIESHQASTDAPKAPKVTIPSSSDMQS